MNYHIGVIQSELAYAIGAKLKHFYTDPAVAARAFTEGVEALRKRYDFGDRVHWPSPHCPAVSYIHLAAIGASLIFPREDGEPNVRPASFAGVREAAEAVRGVREFGACYWVQFYRDFARRLGELLDCEIGPTLGKEGPITSAVLLFGEAFYLSMLEDPEGAKEFLDALCESILAWSDFVRAESGQPPEGRIGGIADDLASLIGPGQWGEFVLPAWARLYGDSPHRSLHCENLTESYLPLLAEAGVTSFDPSRAPKLCPAMLEAALSCGWGWRVQVAHALEGIEEIRRQVREAVEHGAGSLNLFIDRGIEPAHVAAFIEAAEGMGVGA